MGFVLDSASFVIMPGYRTMAYVICMALTDLGIWYLLFLGCVGVRLVGTVASSGVLVVCLVIWDLYRSSTRLCCLISSLDFMMVEYRQALIVMDRIPNR